jgi:hypothetical protein
LLEDQVIVARLAQASLLVIDAKSKKIETFQNAMEVRYRPPTGIPYRLGYIQSVRFGSSAAPKCSGSLRESQLRAAPYICNVTWLTI